MDSNIDLKKLWVGQTSTQPQMQELLSRISKIKKHAMRRLLLTNFILILTSAFIISIWVKYQPEFLTTKIGIILIILAMTSYLFAYNKSLPLLKKIQADQSTADYLRNLLAIQSKQNFLLTTMLNLYFVLLSVGLALYMIEYTSRMTMFWGVFSYVITFMWILLNWFYFRPKQIKKMQVPVDEMILRIKAMNEQFEN